MIKHLVKTAFRVRPKVWSPLAHFLIGGLRVILRIKAIRIMIVHLEVLPPYRSFRFADLLNATRPLLVVDCDLLGELRVGDGGRGWVKSEGIWC